MRALVVLLALTFRVDTTCRPQPPRVYAIVDVSVVPMDRERVIPHQVVIVRGGRIAAMGGVGALRVPSGSSRIDGRGRFLIPGLFDMHVHVEDTTDLLLFLAKGFTTVRNLEGRPEHLEWRRRIRAGQLLGPDLFTSGPFTNLPHIASADDARRAVLEQRAAGYDEIKIHGSIPADAYDTLCAVARRAGIPIVGHAPRNLPFEAMLRCPQVEVSHAEEFIYGYFNYDISSSSVSRLPQFADSVRRSGMHVTTTLVTYRRILAQVQDLDSLMVVTPTQYVRPAQLVTWQRENNRYIRNWGTTGVPKLRERWLFQVALVRALVRAGVPLMTGSDAIGPMWVPGWASQEELQIFVKDIGMTPYEALRSATTVPAAFLGVDSAAGTIAVGKRADLVLLERNPLLDISVIDGIAGVMVRGRWMAGDEIARRLDALARENTRIRDRAAGVLALGWQRAAIARCDTTSPAHSEDIGPIVDLAVQQAFANRISQAGFTQAMTEATAIQQACAEVPVFSESKINRVADSLSAVGGVREAITVLEANVELFPHSFLAPYWLAEAQLAARDTAGAIVNYRRSVANDPGMLDAIERLKSLHAWP